MEGCLRDVKVSLGKLRISSGYDVVWDLRRMSSMGKEKKEEEEGGSGIKSFSVITHPTTFPHWLFVMGSASRQSELGTGVIPGLGRCLVTRKPLGSNRRGCAIVEKRRNVGDVRPHRGNAKAMSSHGTRYDKTVTILWLQFNIIHSVVRQYGDYMG